MKGAVLAQWVKDCNKWRGRVLTGRFGHWCFDWDELPVDETCREWPCSCHVDLLDEMYPEPEPRYPRYDLMLEYWDAGGIEG